MNTKHFLPALLATLFFSITALPASVQAQESQFPQRNEIVRVEHEDDSIGSIPEFLEVFSQPGENGGKHYFLSVGHLGMGDKVVQLVFDPLFELFIPLGDSLDEAIQSLEEMQALYDEPVGTGIEEKGCLAFGFPNDKLETVKVSYRKFLLSRLLEFSVEREGYIRSTHIHRSDFKAILRGVKFHKKLYPND